MLTRHTDEENARKRVLHYLNEACRTILHMPHRTTDLNQLSAEIANCWTHARDYHWIEQERPLHEHRYVATPHNTFLYCIDCGKPKETA